MRRRIFHWMGLGVLFMVVVLCGNALAKETYPVRPGDTLAKIAAKTGVTLKELKAANTLKGSLLQVNQILVIPPKKIGKTAKLESSPISRGEEGYVVKKGDSLFGIARKTGVSITELRELNRLRGNTLQVGQQLALIGKPEREVAVAAPPEYAKSGITPEVEEEEDEADNLLTPEEAWAEIERRKKDNESLLGKWSNPDEPKLLVKVAMGFLGAPYRLGGSSVTGIDCSGFVKKIYEFFNIELPRTALEQSHVGLRVARNELVEGDLIFFHTRRPVGHVGIYIGNNQFVHAASRRKGVRVDNLDTPYYNKRFFRAVRLKGSNDGL